MDEQKAEVPADQQPGVFVFPRQVSGGVVIDYQILGNLDPLSVPSLLEAAVGVARKNIGLPPIR